MTDAPVHLAKDRALPYLSGCLLFSWGAYLFIASELGTDPLDTFALGLRQHLPVTVGLAQAAVAIACLSTVTLWTRRRPALSPLLTFFLCGSVIDVLLIADLNHLAPLPAALLLAAGTVCCAYGSALIIMSGFGIRAMDLLAIVMVEHWRWPFWAAKGILELALLATGWLLGGPAGVGTLCFLVGVDLLIQPLMWLNATVLRVRNLGLPPRPAVAGADLA